MFVSHPQAHRTVGIFNQSQQTLGCFSLKSRHLRLIFSHVGLARHPQDPADFSQVVIQRTERKRAPRALAQPTLCILGPHKGPAPQLLDQLPLQAPADQPGPTDAVVALQESLDPLLLENPQVVEHRATAYPHNIGNLLRAVLVPGHQTHDPQSLPRPITPLALPCLF